MPKNHNGRMTFYGLPDPAALGHDWPELTALRDEYERLQSERAAALGEVRDLTTDKRPKAESGDRQRYARALREGKPDPGTKATDKVDAEIAATRRRAEACDEALLLIEDELVGLFERHSEEWAGDAEAGAEQAQTDAGTALDTFAAATARLAEQRSLLAYVERFPERSTFRVPGMRVAGLPAPNGEPVWLEVAVRALGETVAPACAGGTVA